MLVAGHAADSGGILYSDLFAAYLMHKSLGLSEGLLLGLEL